MRQQATTAAAGLDMWVVPAGCSGGRLCLCLLLPLVAAGLQPVCLLLQLSALGFHDKRLVELLEHPNIIKVGSGAVRGHSIPAAEYVLCKLTHLWVLVGGVGGFSWHWHFNGWPARMKPQ